MTVIIPFHAGDVHLAAALLEWIGKLGHHPKHNCLLVVDAAMDWGASIDCLNLAHSIFRSASIITNDKPTQGWIPGSNSLFAAAAKHMEQVGEPFLWLEPDATPLVSGWLDRIANAYSTSHKPFLGSLVRHDLSNRPNPYFEGCGVYPADTWSRIKNRFILEESWTLWCADEVVPHAADCPLFQHFWGMENLSPTFVEQKLPGAPVNTLALSFVRPDAVLFHRCKDGSLLRLLRNKMFHMEYSNRFVVVLPFCNKDGGMMIKNLRWMQRLGGCQKDTVILAYDRSTSPEFITPIQQLASRVFGSVSNCIYSVPARQDVAGASKHAFRSVAKFIAPYRRAFLWFEADMVAVKHGWLDKMQTVYAACGKPFFGPVVPGMGHFNGTAVYPANTAQICPSIWWDNDDAWDTGIRDETRGKVFDASAYIQHAWVMEHGRMKPHGSGEQPQFRTVDDVRRMLHPTALTFHRDKSLSLIDRLTEMKIA